MGSRTPQDIDWDRIDKQKFFFLGIGAFSGVTTLLYPLSVIKTNQQAAHGSQTTAQTTAMIWKTRGLPGFYRGFNTVIFGTIPARMVYLSSLEVTKSAVTKAGHQLGFDEATNAYWGGFAGGAISSLITQVVTVPMDVVSQRQMVHTSTTAATPSASSASQGQGTGTGVNAGSGSSGVAGASAAPSTSQSSSALPGSRAGVGTGAPSSMQASSSGVGSSGGTGTGGAGGSGQGKAGMHTLAVQRLGLRGAQQGQALCTTGLSSLPSTVVASALQARVQQEAALRTGEAAPSCSGCQAPAVRGLHTKAGAASVAHFGRAAGRATCGTITAAATAASSTASLRSISTSSATAHAAGATATLQQGVSAVQIVRVILKEEGVMGLYRGFGASIITYVPSSAIWWGCYGLYQKMAWRMLGDRPLLPQGDGAAAWGAVAPDAPAALSRADSTFGPRPKTNGSSSTSGSSADGSRSGPASAGPHQVVAGGRADHGSGGAASGSVAAAGSGHAGGRELSTMDVVLVQTASSCLAGMTSAGVTSPLDLVKTRIQVAQKQQGQAVTFRAVFMEVLREDGWSGFFRAAGPRMANSALWGTAMMSVYEALKRFSLKEEP